LFCIQDKIVRLLTFCCSKLRVALEGHRRKIIYGPLQHKKISLGLSTEPLQAISQQQAASSAEIRERDTGTFYIIPLANKLHAGM
jgi:hypothetical protein